MPPFSVPLSARPLFLLPVFSVLDGSVNPLVALPLFVATQAVLTWTGRYRSSPLHPHPYPVLPGALAITFVFCPSCRCCTASAADLGETDCAGTLSSVRDRVLLILPFFFLLSPVLHCVARLWPSGFYIYFLFWTPRPQAQLLANISVSGPSFSSCP